MGVPVFAIHCITPRRRTRIPAGLFILGSPMEERARRVDDRRVADLHGIVAATDLYWPRHSRLPSSLDDLTDEPGVRISTGDPARSEIYGYQPLDSVQYEVCASFERESGEPSRDPARIPPITIRSAISGVRSRRTVVWVGDPASVPVGCPVDLKEPGSNPGFARRSPALRPLCRPQSHRIAYQPSIC